MAQIINAIIISKNDTEENWLKENPILENSEIGYDSTNKIIKIGDGQTAWTSLKGISLFAVDGKGNEIFNSPANSIGEGTVDIPCQYNHVEGYQVACWGNAGHVEGRGTYLLTDVGVNEAMTDDEIIAIFKKTNPTKKFMLVRNNAAHGEGSSNLSLGDSGHVEGAGNINTGQCSHVEGQDNECRGGWSHIEGNHNYIGQNGLFTHVGGHYNQSNSQNQYVIGYSNKYDDNAYFIVGNGPDSKNRRNTFAIGKDDSVKIYGKISDINNGLTLLPSTSSTKIPAVGDCLVMNPESVLGVAAQSIGVPDPSLNRIVISAGGWSLANLQKFNLIEYYYVQDKTWRTEEIKSITQRSSGVFNVDFTNNSLKFLNLELSDVSNFKLYQSSGMSFGQPLSSPVHSAIDFVIPNSTGSSPLIKVNGIPFLTENHLYISNFDLTSVITQQLLVGNGTFTDSKRCSSIGWSNVQNGNVNSLLIGSTNVTKGLSNSFVVGNALTIENESNLISTFGKTGQRVLNIYGSLVGGTAQDAYVEVANGDLKVSKGSVEVSESGHIKLPSNKLIGKNNDPQFLIEEMSNNVEEAVPVVEMTYETDAYTATAVTAIGSVTLSFRIICTKSELSNTKIDSSIVGSTIMFVGVSGNVYATVNDFEDRGTTVMIGFTKESDLAQFFMNQPDITGFKQAFIEFKIYKSTKSWRATKVNNDQFKSAENNFELNKMTFGYSVGYSEPVEDNTVVRCTYTDSTLLMDEYVNRIDNEIIPKTSEGYGDVVIFANVYGKDLNDEIKQIDLCISPVDRIDDYQICVDTGVYPTDEYSIGTFSDWVSKSINIKSALSKWLKEVYYINYVTNQITDLFCNVTADLSPYITGKVLETNNNYVKSYIEESYKAGKESYKNEFSNAYKESNLGPSVYLNSISDSANDKLDINVDSLNLCRFPYIAYAQNQMIRTINGVTWKISESGLLEANGTPTGASEMVIMNNYAISNFTKKSVVFGYLPSDESVTQENIGINVSLYGENNKVITTLGVSGIKTSLTVDFNLYPTAKSLNFIIKRNNNNIETSLSAYPYVCYEDSLEDFRYFRLNHSVDVKTNLMESLESYSQQLPYTANGVTFTKNSNGTIHVTGTASSNTEFYLINSNRNELPEAIQRIGKFVGLSSTSISNTDVSLIFQIKSGSNYLVARDSNFDSYYLGQNLERGWDRLVLAFSVKSGKTVNADLEIPKLYNLDDNFSDVKVSVTNKNLITRPYESGDSYLNNGITFTTNSDGSVSATGVNTGSAYYWVSTAIVFNPGNYYLSGCPSNGGSTKHQLYIRLAEDGTKDYKYLYDNGSGVSVAVTKRSTASVGIVVRSDNVNPVSLTFYPQLESGTTATSYTSTVEKKSYNSDEFGKISIDVYRPNSSVICDTSGVSISAKYNKDIITVIDELRNTVDVKDAETLGDAKTYADPKDSKTLASAKNYTDTKAKGYAPLDANGKIPDSYLYGVTVKQYGVRWNGTSSTVCERLGDAVGLTAKAHKGSTESVDNDFDNIYPWSDIKTCNIDVDGNVLAYLGEPSFARDGTNGDVMVEIPKFYYKRVKTGIVEEIWICGTKLPGYELHPLFIDNGKEVSKVFHSVYNASSFTDKTDNKVKLQSITGVQPMVRKRRENFRTYARNKGAIWGIEDISCVNALQLLYLVEYADTNSQSVLGSGADKLSNTANHKALEETTNGNTITISSTYKNIYKLGQRIEIGTSQGVNNKTTTPRTITAITTDEETGQTTITFDGGPITIAVGNMIWNVAPLNGSCDDLNGKSGWLAGENNYSDHYADVNYRGIEGFHAKLFRFIDGVNIKDRVVYYANSMADYADGVYDGKYRAVGYSNAESNGYVSSFGYDEKAPCVMFPLSAAGGSSTFVPDYYYQDAGERQFLLGGSWSDGARAGAFNFLCYGDFSFSSFSSGAHILVKKP